ncbi:MAG: peptidylprolyl isomerase, partial [bacterium]|nr:peptidylprolyl isomerase [Candidatus Kapabacteria bacterium]
VTDGQDVVDKIATTKTGQQDKPVDDVIMKTVTIDGGE